MHHQADSSSNRSFKIGLIQEKWFENPEEHRQAQRKGVAEAVARGARLVCLQELTMHRYFGDKNRTENPEVFEYAEELDPQRGVFGPSASFFSDLARDNKVHLIGSLYEKTANNEYYNTAVIFGPDGSFVGMTRKQHIPKGTGYDEIQWFQSANGEYPVHDLGFVKLGVPTCYDQWFPELARIYGLKGAELLVYPTAIGSEPEHPELDTQPAWQIVMQSHAIVNGLFVAAVNRVGTEGVTFYGSSFVCDPRGRIIAQAPRHDPCVLVVDVDFATQHLWRKVFPLLQQRHPETYGLLVKNDSECCK